jgi:hypothetical protein
MGSYVSCGVKRWNAMILIAGILFITASKDAPAKDEGWQLKEVKEYYYD